MMKQQKRLPYGSLKKRPIPIGPIDLADYDYRLAKLIEFRAVLNLDQDRRVAGAAAIALNWSTLAQTKIGAPESDFADESLVRLHGVDDEIGLHATGSQALTIITSPASSRMGLFRG